MKPVLKICFLANFSKTYFFHAIASELSKQHDVQVFWITTNRGLFDFLVNHYPTEQALLINKDQLDKITEVVGDYKINELIYGDRVLRHDKLEGQKWLTVIQRPIYNFIQQQKIQYVFGEITWAHEVLIHRMCKKNSELNCTFLNPHVVRLPNDRFAFFEDERQSVIHQLEQPEQFFDQVLKVKKPDYLGINDRRLKKANSISGRMDRIRRFLTNENIDKKDPTILANGKARFRTRSLEELYKETYKLISREPFERFKEQAYIFVGLHKQPEASVDVFGRYTEDQFQNIINIWRVLPPGWKLLIKEHTNAIGDRKPAFYKELAALPNVHFVDEQTDSYQLIHGAKAVVTITGTIALEAALMGVPALTFAPVFFNQLNNCHHLTLSDLITCSSIIGLIDDLRSRPDNRLAFTNFLLNHSFVGTFSDPISNQKILEQTNIKNIAKAFAQVLRLVQEPQVAIQSE